MTRVEFCNHIIDLLHEMKLLGERPLIDFVKRSDEEQNRLFKEGKSKCDGYKVRSKHQYGCAMDIYFVGEAGLEEPKMGWNHWHNRWQELGGQPAIIWDLSHFE